LGFVLSQLWRDSTKAHGALETDCWCGAVLADEAALAVDRGNIAAVTARVTISSRLLGLLKSVLIVPPTFDLALVLDWPEAIHNLC
jgi:hypothetical protein